MTGSLRVSKFQSLRGETEGHRSAEPLCDFATLRLCHFSTPPAQTPAHILWTKNADLRNPVRPAENGPISLSFLPFRLTGPKGQHCYTFERFAAPPVEIHTYYYYHYKR